MVDNEIEDKLAELGLTTKRADELIDITRSIIGRNTKNECGIMNIGPCMNMDCMVIAPGEIPEHDMEAIVISLTMSLISNMPKNVAIDFCKNMRDIFARIVETGDIRLHG